MNWICVTCGTQFPSSEVPPKHCPICEDERQYIGHGGQQWTTLSNMKSQGYKNTYCEHEPNLVGISTTPEFAIGQPVYLIRTPEGNILWESLSYIDDITVELIQGLGGIKAIALSHPHFYSSMVEWAERFDAKIYLNARDKEWVMHPSSKIEFWDEQIALTSDVTLHQVGGHFEGSSVLSWSTGAGGKGVLLTGDTVSICVDPNWVTFLYSFPNRVPLSSKRVHKIKDTICRLQFERLYDTFGVISIGAKDVIKRSAQRYIDMLTE